LAAAQREALTDSKTIQEIVMEPCKESSPREQRLNEVLAAWYEQREAGAEPDRAALLAAHPDLADELASFFAARDDFERTAEGLLPQRESAAVATCPSPVSAPAGLDVAGHELLEEIGRGGMGVVYRARQVTLERVVALKMVRAGGLASPEDIQRFRAEAAVVASLDHPHLVPVYEVGEHDGLPWYSMKLIHGDNLAQRLQAGPLEPRRAAELLATVARAVHHAHRRGVLHRDLKPANILLDELDAPVVADFGLAKRLEESAELTRSHTILGSARYMAPEQAAGQSRHLTTACDVHALGAILYECLAGRPAFQGDSTLDVLQRVRHEAPPPLSPHGRVPRDLEVITLKCLQKEPQRRYASAAELAEDLERFLEGVPISARPSSSAERLWRWSVRNPLAAGLGGALLSLLLVGLIGATVAAVRLDTLARKEGEAATAAGRARDIAKEKQAAAVAEQKKAEAARDLLKIILADRYWVEADVARAERYLDSCAPEHRHWEWHYLKRLCHQELLNIPSQVGIMPGGLQAAFSPDGKLIATDGVEKLPRKLKAPPLPPPAPGTIPRPPTGEGEGETTRKVVRLLDATTGKVLRTFPLKPAGDNPDLWDSQTFLTSLAFTPDGKGLSAGVRIRLLPRPQVTAASNNDPHLAFVVTWSTSDGRQRSCWEIPDPKKIGHNLHLAYNHDGTRLAVAAHYYRAHLGTGAWLFDTSSGKVLRHFSDAGRHAAFSPDGRYLAFSFRHERALGGGYKTWDTDSVHVWDLKADRELYTAKSPPEVGQCGGPHAFSPDGKLLYSLHYSNILVREAATGREVRRFMAAGGSGLALSRDGKRLATAPNAAARILDATTGRSLACFPGHSRVDSLTFDAEAVRLLTTGAEGTVRVWDARQDREGFELLSAPPAVDRAPWRTQAVSPDGRVVATKQPGWLLRLGVVLTDAATGKFLRRLPLDTPRQVNLDNLYEREDYFTSPMVFNGDGSRLALAGAGRPVRIHDVATGKEVAVCKGHTAQSIDLAFSPDGKRLASAGRDFTVLVWDAATGRELARYKGDGKRNPSRVAFSSDGRKLAVAYACRYVPVTPDARQAEGSGEVCVHGPDGGEPVVLRGPEGSSFNGLAFSPDGKHVAASCERGGAGVILWDLHSRKALWRLSDCKDVGQVAFTSDGARVATLHSGCVMLWSTGTGQEVLTLRHGGSLNYLGCFGLFFSGDGHRLYGSYAGGLRCWDATPMLPPARK
jgi:WD40 repeat protein